MTVLPLRACAAAYNPDGIAKKPHPTVDGGAGV